MGASHTMTSRLATAATGMLAVTELAVLLVVDVPYIKIIMSVLTVMTALAAAKLYRDNCVESRVLSVFVSVGAAAGVILSATFGLPGSPAHRPDLGGVVMFVLAVAILILAAIDRRRRQDILRRGAPYAL